MARPIKTGLEYFSHDVNLSSDDKVQFIEAKHGIIGYAVFCKLLEKIYKNGYYCRWEERDAIMFSKFNTVELNTLNEIISDCINEGLFSANLYNTYSILTSGSIQMRYIMGSVKRKTVCIIKNYFCINENRLEHTNRVTLTGINGEVIEVISTDSTQSKVKERKENKSRGEETPPPVFLKITYEEFLKSFKAENDFASYAKYDLQIYFRQAIEKYPEENSLSVIIKRVKKFISSDMDSKGKFSPHLAPAKKSDSVTAAYELVRSNLDWIKNFPDKNPDEVIPELVKKCRDPARNDTLFEAYIEKALRHYSAFTDT